MTTCEELNAALAADDSTSVPSGTTLHLLECACCRALWLSARLIGESRDDVGSEVAGACPEAERLVELIDGPAASSGRQDPRTRQKTIEHLDLCEDCMGQTLQLIAQADLPEHRDLVSPPARLERRALALAGAASTPDVVVRFPHRERWLAGLAAAAGLAFVAIGLGLILPAPGFRPDADSAEGTLLRGTPADAPRAVAPLGVVNDTEGLEFSWNDPRPEPADALAGRLYHLVVVDLDRGTTVIDLQTRASRHLLTPSEAARLEPGGHYHWLVEPVGESSGRPSAAVEFRIAGE